MAPKLNRAPTSILQYFMAKSEALRMTAERFFDKEETGLLEQVKRINERNAKARARPAELMRENPTLGEAEAKEKITAELRKQGLI